MMLNDTSPKALHPNNINITLKQHQLAMLQRCIDIENNNENICGIMNDKPGTGKTFVVLSLINYFKLNKNSPQTNIIIVPQNIYTQWITSIEKFSSSLTYNKFIQYENIINLYMNPSILNNTDIIITTSSYYHIIATTLSSLNIKINRIFFDEIDTISNIVITKIDTDFIWFISASFNINYLGYYGDLIKNYDLENITCKCDEKFIDDNVYLEPPIKKYYVCNNLYIDNVLYNVISSKELKYVNSISYIYEKERADNEVELIDLIIKNNKSKLDFNQYQVDDSNKNILHYNNCITNTDKSYNSYNELINKLNDNIIQHKKYIIDLIENYQSSYKQSIKYIMDDIIDNYYNLNNIYDVCFNHLTNKNNSLELTNIITNIKKLIVNITNLLSLIDDMKDDNVMFYELWKISTDYKLYYENLMDEINNYIDIVNAPDEIEINNKRIEISNKVINENKKTLDIINENLNKINLDDNINDINTNSQNISNINEINEKIKMTGNLNITFEYFNENKKEFLKNYILNLKDKNTKVIIFADYSNVFHYIENICNEHNIKFIDLDKGNINEIDVSVNNYKFGDVNILLSNSTLFGCGMNFENADEILFIHNMNKNMEKQVIGRAQRLGRKTVLNIIYLQYFNEFNNIDYVDNDIINISKEDDVLNTDEDLTKYYENKQINNILNNIKNIDLTIISGNELETDDLCTTPINDNLNTSLSLFDIPDEPLDINLDELISSLG